MVAGRFPSSQLTLASAGLFPSHLTATENLKNNLHFNHGHAKQLLGCSDAKDAVMQKVLLAAVK